MSRRSRPAGRVTSRRSWSTLIAWGVVIAALAFLGKGLEGRLAPMSLAVPGSPSSRAEAMLAARFGNTIPIAVLLRGPPAQVDRQGQRLVSALRGIAQVQVLSPWDGSVTLRSLRPNSRSAFVLVNYIRPASRAMAVVPLTEAVVARTVQQPVRSYLTGVAVIGRALQQATLADTEQAEMIALPVLILVLLLVFRSPVAAAVPLTMGAATVMAGHGLLWLASFLTPINSLGVAIAAMMSLALGVDYALLMVSRVRQELAGGCDHATAVAIASRAAGRTIAAAGGTLALTMLAASGVATPGLLGPVAIGVVISGLLSVALALTAMPALLRLLGPRLDRWEVRLARPGTARPRTGAGAVAERLIAHPAITVPLILVGMLALAAPAGALRMGPPDASELPASSPARIAVRMVERTIGPGWSAPFVIVASADSGAITAPQAHAGADALAAAGRARARRRGGARPGIGGGRGTRADGNPCGARVRAKAPGRRPARHQGPARGIEPCKRGCGGAAKRPCLGRSRREIARRRQRTRRERRRTAGRSDGRGRRRRKATRNRHAPRPRGRNATGERNRPRPRGRERDSRAKPAAPGTARANCRQASPRRRRARPRSRAGSTKPPRAPNGWPPPTVS